MRASPAVIPGRIRVGLLLALAVSALSCVDGPTDPGRVGRLEVAVPTDTLRPGFHVRAVPTIYDVQGAVVHGRAVTWRSLTPATLAVSAEGLLLALAPGTGIARASIGSVSAEVALALVNPPVATLTLDADTVRLLVPGGSQTMTATALDDDGVVIRGVALNWESSAPRIAGVSAAGLVNAEAVGSARVTVRAEAHAVTSEVFVTAPVTPGGPLITQVTPASVAPGQIVALSGANFGPTPAANTVLIDGTPVVVTSATSTQLLLALPSAMEFSCAPTRTVAVQVSTSLGIGVAPVTLSVATPRTLSVGQSLVLTSLADARCNEFPADGGRYVVTVQNTSRALGAGSAGLTLRGAATSVGGSPLRAPLSEWRAGGGAAIRLGPAAVPPPAERIVERLQGQSAHARSLAAHARLMELNQDLLRVSRPAAKPSPPLGTASLSTPLPGAILPVRVANLGAPTFCNAFTNIGARAVFVGDRFVVLEDTASVANGVPTLRGQMDNLYISLGVELEDRIWPIAQAFGDPLVMDNRLDANGRVFVVFSPQMNQVLGGAALAAVVNCDFFPRAQFASSNVGEFIYAQVPTSPDAGFGPGTRTRWLHEIRGTLAHELRHITSFAERIVRGQPLEERWLEEATARHAEELFARAVFGTTQHGNHGFSATLACELGAADPAQPACAQAPRAMLPHFEGLWDYLDASVFRSPLGAATANDFSFYGSAWALTRWILDQQGLDEAAFYTALTRSGQSGLANLEGRTGRPWDEMLGEWSLAMATDDRTGFTSASPRVRFPSWDLTGIFGGVCAALGPCPESVGARSRFTRPYPLRPTTAVGDFVVEIPAVVAGGFAAIEVRSPAAGFRQLLALDGYHGAALPASARLAIVRVE